MSPEGRSGNVPIVWRGGTKTSILVLRESAARGRSGYRCHGLRASRVTRRKMPGVWPTRCRCQHPRRTRGFDRADPRPLPGTHIIVRTAFDFFGAAASWSGARMRHILALCLVRRRSAHSKEPSVEAIVREAGPHPGRQTVLDPVNPGRCDDCVAGRVT